MAVIYTDLSAAEFWFRLYGRILDYIDGGCFVCLLQRKAITGDRQPGSLWLHCFKEV